MLGKRGVEAPAQVKEGGAEGPTRKVGDNVINVGAERSRQSGPTKRMGCAQDE